MLLTEEQMRLIALLPAEPGYILLLDSIQADLDDLADRMEVEPDDRKLTGLTREWQALRKVLSILKTRPERIREEYASLEPYPEELRPPPLKVTSAAKAKL